MTTATPTDEKFDNLNLLKVEADKPAPKSRLTDPKRAQSLAENLVSAGAERSRKNALLKGQIDGNLPYQPIKLKVAGQSWRTNVNFGEAKASVSAALTPFYDLFTGSKHYFFIETDYGSNARERNELSKAITEEADYHVKEEWDGFDFNIQAMLFEMVTYGKGFINWPIKQSDWRFQWLAQHLIYVPDNTKAHGSKVPVAVIRQEYLVHELHHLIQQPRAGQSGWNVEFAKRCIEHAYPPQKGLTGQYDYEAIQQRIRDNDICEGMEAEKIPVYHILVTELNEKVSYFIVPESTVPNGKHATKDEPVEFIYQGVEEFEDFGQAVTTFFFETLDGSWNGANGLAKELYAPIEIKNRLTCSTIDGAFLQTAINLQPKDAGSMDKMNMIQIGAANIWPAGVDVLDSKILGDINSSMMVDQLLDNKLQTNTGIWRGRRDKPQGNPRTAKEVEIDYNQSATLGNSSVNRFYLNLDRLYKELLRRLAKDEAFRKRCKDRGIPEPALDKIRCVKAVRTVGNGSPMMRQQALREMGPIVPMMSESGRMEWARDTAAATLNTYAAQRYFPGPGDDVGQTDHAAWAAIENVSLKLGAPVVWTPTQNNVIHAQTHIQFAAAAADSLSKGGDPLDVMNTIDHVAPHALLHLEHLKGDEIRKVEIKALEEQMKRLTAIADELRAEIKRRAQQAAQDRQKEQQAQQVEAGLDPETRIKQAKAQSDMQIKEMKAQQQMTHKHEAHLLKVATTDAKTAATIAQMQAKAEQQAELAAASASKGED